MLTKLSESNKFIFKMLDSLNASDEEKAQIKCHIEKKLQYLNGIFTDIDHTMNVDESLEFLHKYSDNYERTNLLIAMKEHGLLNDESFNACLKVTYTSAKSPSFNETLREYFNICNKDYVMSKEEQEFLDNLPNEVILYRGCSTDEYDFGKFGMSWTTERKVAEFFAFRFNQHNAVYQIKVNKNQIKAFFIDRHEFEAILTDVNYDEVEETTDEPTELYDEYLRDIEESRRK